MPLALEPPGRPSKMVTFRALRVLARVDGIADHLDDYRRMRSLAIETAAAIEHLDYVEIGRLMDDNWELKRRLSDGVSSPTIDQWYALAKQNGALGGKLMGAGGGGFLFFLVPPERQRDVQRALEGVGLLMKPVCLDIDGSSIIFRE